MTTSVSTLKITDFLNQQSSKLPKGVFEIKKIPGDASTRVYYRICYPEKTYILMSMDNFEKEGESLDFLSIQKHLYESGTDVPQVLAFSAKEGFILLEDLGDRTLLRELQSVSNQTLELEIYEQVIDELIHMHLHASPKNGENKKVCAFDLHFNHTKLMWEVDFCIEHFYKTYLARTIKDKDLDLMRSKFSEICTFLANEPEVFTHRDFHSRNVMVTDHGIKNGNKKRFVMIDFQDARMGPAAYDLASLLRDSYYQLSEVQVSRLIDYYMTRRSALEGVRIKPAEFMRSFDLMSVQRNFKAIGSFASFLNRRGNPGYLKYIGNTFENIRRTLLKYPEYAELREVLFHYYYF